MRCNNMACDKFHNQKDYEQFNFNARHFAISEGIYEACRSAAEHGFSVEAVAMNPNSFLTMCLSLGKAFTATKEPEVWMKIKTTEERIDCVQVYGDPTVPAETAFMMGELVLDPRRVGEVSLSG